MRKTYLLLIGLLAASCSNSNKFNIEGTTTNLNNGVFGVNDVTNKPIYGENISGGKFKVQGMLEYAGFYLVKVTNTADAKAPSEAHEVYLEGGDYTFTVDGKDLTKYPKIETDSKIQNDLSAFYTLRDQMVTSVEKAIAEKKKFLKAQGSSLRPDLYLKQVDSLEALNNQAVEMQANVLEKFLAQHADSPVAAHLMANTDYQSDPVRFFALYNKMSGEAKGSAEGKEIGETLGRLVKLVPGQKAPEIYGTNPDGQAFDPAKSKKKIYLIDFWRAGNEVSRMNHLQMASKLFFQVNNNKDFGIISINLDQEKDFWLKAIKEDGMKWPQYSDLKGNESENVRAWGISKVPTYYLLDGNWKVLQRDIEYKDISFEISDYLDKH